MRSTTSVAAFALAMLQGTSAFNNAASRKYGQMAEMGYNPDGSPIDNTPIDVSAFSSLKDVVSSSGAVSVAAAKEVVSPEYVTLPIDEFAKDSSVEGTYNNRFWVAESGYKPGGPVFVYDVGEGDAAPNALFRLQNETSFFKQIVDSFGGLGIVWEHRFCKSTHLIIFCNPGTRIQNLSNWSGAIEREK